MNTQAVTHGTKAIIGGRRVTFGTVIGYTLEKNAECGRLLQYHQCPIARHEDAVRRGHETEWINLSSGVICGDKGYYERDRAEWAGALILNVGDDVMIDGKLRKIHAAPNNNFILRA